MSGLFIVLTCISIAGILALTIHRFIRNRNAANLAINLAVLSAFIFFLYKIFNRLDTPVPMGDENKEIYFVIVLYMFMVLGMLASHGYSRFSKPKKKRGKFDFGNFIAPVFASPLVFLPLLAAFQNADMSLETLTSARMMTFLVAFQNGFFWKEYFDNLQKEKTRETKKKK